MAESLSVLQARALAVLVEKAKTVPDTYPLSLNALTSGCNQKNNRDPVMNASEAQVQEALDALHARSLVSQSSGARVTRYEHNMQRALRVPEQAVALLATLMLRGPQTAGELRINSERLHRFADIASVEAFLEELATRAEAAGGPLVVLLARQPGEREQRWAHLLCGPVAVASATPAGVADGVGRSASTETVATAPDALTRVQAEVAALRTEVAELRAIVQQIQADTRR